jgi:hypothetical protein
VTSAGRAATHLLSPGIAAARLRGDASETGGPEAVTDLLDRLADVDVPPVPTAPEFTAGVRRKLHPRLLAAHVAGFALQALPWAAVQFVGAVLAVVRFSLTGSWPRQRGAREEERR